MDGRRHSGLSTSPSPLDQFDESRPLSMSRNRSSPTLIALSSPNQGRARQGRRASHTGDILSYGIPPPPLSRKYSDLIVHSDKDAQQETKTYRVRRFSVEGNKVINRGDKIKQRINNREDFSEILSQGPDTSCSFSRYNSSAR